MFPLLVCASIDGISLPLKPTNLGGWIEEIELIFETEPISFACLTIEERDE